MVQRKCFRKGNQQTLLEKGNKRSSNIVDLQLAQSTNVIFRPFFSNVRHSLQKKKKHQNRPDNTN